MLVFSILFGCIATLPANSHIFDVLQQKERGIKALFNEEQYYDIISQYAEKDKKKMSEDELLYVAWSYYMLNESDKASEYIPYLTGKQSKNAEAYYLNGLILITSDKADEALPSILKAIECDPADGRFYTAVGNLYRDRDDVSAAIDYYKKGISANKTSEQAYFMLADIYDYVGKHNEALATFYDAKKHIRKDEELYATVLYNIGTMEMDKKNYRQAIDAYNELVVFFPDDYLTYTRLIQCCYALGDYEIGDTYKSVLFDAYQNGLLTDGEFAEKFCIDNFSVGDKVVSAYEFFQSVEENAEKSNTPIYVFYVVNSKGLVEREIRYSSLLSDKSFEYLIDTFSLEDGSRTKIGVREGLEYVKLKTLVKDIVLSNYTLKLTSPIDK